MHRKRRAALNPFFSKQKVMSLEPVIRNQIEKLVRRIDEFASSGNVLPIGVAYGAATMDIISEYALEKSYGNLEHPDFNQELVEFLNGFGKQWHLGKHFHLLWLLLSNLPQWMFQKLDPKSSSWKAFQRVCSRDFILFTKKKKTWLFFMKLDFVIVYCEISGGQEELLVPYLVLHSKKLSVTEPTERCLESTLPNDCFCVRLPRLSSEMFLCFVVADMY